MKRLLIALVKFYRRYISPLKPPCCRFIPTCSNYSIEAFEKHGALKGLWMTITRLARCHPFGGSGYDPVPGKFRWRCWCHDAAAHRPK